MISRSGETCRITGRNQVHDMDPDRVRVTSVVNEGMDHGFTGTFPDSDLHSLAFSSFLLWDKAPLSAGLP